VVQS
jgi:hypothetical protein